MPATEPLLDMSSPDMLTLPAEGPGSKAWSRAVDAEVYRRCEAEDLICYCSGDRDCWKCQADGPAEQIADQVWDEMEALWDAQHVEAA